MESAFRNPVQTWKDVMLGIPEVAIGAMVAALFAGLVSLLGLIISKEQKISEFRQAWINSLQTDIASLISHANAIHSGEHAGYTSGSEAWKVVRPDFLGINQAAANIRLSLNPNECESLAVLRQIKNVEDLLAPGKAVDYRRLDEIEHELVRKAQILLKKEWIRVKRGERVYRTTSVVFFVVVIALVCFLSGLLLLYALSILAT